MVFSSWEVGIPLRALEGYKTSQFLKSVPRIRNPDCAVVHCRIYTYPISNAETRRMNE